MTKKIAVYLVGLFALTSCFLTKDFRTSIFQFRKDGDIASIPVIAPKGFLRQEKIDTAGITLTTYYYPYGTVFYVAHLKDTSYKLQDFNQRLHQPRREFWGASVFKGVDTNGLFYREIQEGNLRVGYLLVPDRVELLFDSATNFVASQMR